MKNTAGENFTIWLAAKSRQGLVMPCHDDRAPMIANPVMPCYDDLITPEEAVTLAVLSDAMEQLRRMM